MSVRKALRYTKRGKHRRVLIRRLSGTPSSPASPRCGDTMRRRLRLGIGSGSSVVKKRKGASRLGRTPRARVAKLPAQIYCTDFCRWAGCLLLALYGLHLLQCPKVSARLRNHRVPCLLGLLSQAAICCLAGLASARSGSAASTCTIRPRWRCVPSGCRATARMPTASCSTDTGRS